MPSTIGRALARLLRQAPTRAFSDLASSTTPSPNATRPSAEALANATLEQLQRHVEHLEQHFIGDAPAPIGRPGAAWTPNQARKLAGALAKQARALENEGARAAAVPVWALKRRAEQGLLRVRIRESNTLEGVSPSLLGDVMAHHAALSTKKRDPGTEGE